MKDKNKTNCGEESVDAILKKFDATKITNQLNAVTPILAVYMVAQNGKKTHFANFYGTTIEETEGLNQAKVEAQVQKNDGKIFDMILELEQKINAGDFKKIKSDLFVEVNWAKLGSFMHKEQSKREDTLACSSVERAFNLFERVYKDVGKTDKQILDERMDSFRESLEAGMKFF